MINRASRPACVPWAARKRFDLFRESWIEGLIERRDIIVAANKPETLSCLLLRYTLVVSKITQYSLSSRGVEQRSDLLDTAAFRRLLCRSFLYQCNDNIITTNHCRSNNSVLVSSSLILMGVVGNLLLQMPQVTDTGIAPNHWVEHPYIFIIIVVFFGVKFIFFQDFTHKTYK